MFVTNNILVADRHVRVAVGRDYADVPPTRGTFKRVVESELGVAVRVEPTLGARAPRGIPARVEADVFAQ
jgi:hypothetical protein